MIDDEIPWLTATTAYKRTSSQNRPADGAPLYSYVQECARHGLVFRLRENTTIPMFAPGLLEKNASGTKWIWKEQTTEKLEEKGINIMRPYGPVLNKYAYKK